MFPRDIICPRNISINTLYKGVDYDEDDNKYYKYTPANVLKNENIKLYWNRSILTDKTVPFNRPDITFMNKTKTKSLSQSVTRLDLHPNTYIQLKKKSVISGTCSIVRNFLNYK